MKTEGSRGCGVIDAVGLGILVIIEAGWEVAGAFYVITSGLGYA